MMKIRIRLPKLPNDMRHLNKVLLAVVAAAIVLAGACKAPEGLEESVAPPTPELSEFERELRSLKTADFDYIYVLRRKDGEPFTAEDREFIRQNRHHATNRSSLSEDEKIIFVGSNFAFEDESLANLKERFAFEDFSKPQSQIEKEQEEEGTNTNKNGNAKGNGQK